MKTKMNFHVIGLGDEPLDTTQSATSKKKKERKICILVNDIFSFRFQVKAHYYSTN